MYSSYYIRDYNNWILYLHPLLRLVLARGKVPTRCLTYFNGYHTVMYMYLYRLCTKGIGDGAQEGIGRGGEQERGI